MDALPHDVPRNGRDIHPPYLLYLEDFQFPISAPCKLGFSRAWDWQWVMGEFSSGIILHTSIHGQATMKGLSLGDSIFLVPPFTFPLPHSRKRQRKYFNYPPLSPLGSRQHTPDALALAKMPPPPQHSRWHQATIADFFEVESHALALALNVTTLGVKIMQGQTHLGLRRRRKVQCCCKKRFQFFIFFAGSLM